MINPINRKLIWLISQIWLFLLVVAIALSRTRSYYAVGDRLISWVLLPFILVVWVVALNVSFVISLKQLFTDPWKDYFFPPRYQPKKSLMILIFNIFMRGFGLRIFRGDILGLSLPFFQRPRLQPEPLFASIQ
jgi:hypothetical protein